MAKLKHLSLREEIIETCLKMNEEGINQARRKRQCTDRRRLPDHGVPACPTTR